MGSPFDWSQLQHPKALADALSSNVCWARVKGYPYWPAQVLNDGAAQKKLGKIKHTADAVPVMFFGTLEIAWIGQSDIVCFKDGVLQGFLVKGKHKSFLKACGQVYEFLMLDKKRRAPQYWWCRAPSNGLDAGPDDESNLTTSKPTSPAFNRPTSSKAHTPRSAPPASTTHTPGSNAEDEEENESASEAEEQEALLLCAAPKEGKVCKLPPPSKRKAALPPPAPKQQSRPSHTGGTKGAGMAGRQAAERKGSGSSGGVGAQHGTWARNTGGGSNEGSSSSSGGGGSSGSEDEGVGGREDTAGAMANGGSGKVSAAQEKKGKLAQAQPGNKRPAPSQSKQQQANGTEPKGGSAHAAQGGEAGSRAIPASGVPTSHLPPKKKLRTAAEAGEAKPGGGSAATATTAVAVGPAGESAGAWPEAAVVKQEAQEQFLEGSKDCQQQQQQQQNSESTAATTTTTTQMQAPPSFSRQHSCMELEEDVSASLPAEIRRLAGIKLVKRPPPTGAGSTELPPNITSNTSNHNNHNNNTSSNHNNNTSSNYNNNNTSGNSNKAGVSKGAAPQRSTAPSCAVLASPKSEQAAESPRRSREDADEACGKSAGGVLAATSGQCSLHGLRCAASADLEGCAAHGAAPGGGPEALLPSNRRGGATCQLVAGLGSSSPHEGEVGSGFARVERGQGGPKCSLAAACSVPVTGCEVTACEAGVGGSVTEGSEAAAVCAAAAAAEAQGERGEGTVAGGGESASPGAGMPTLAGPPAAAASVKEQGSVKEEVLAAEQPPPLSSRRKGGRGLAREGKEGGRQVAAGGKEVGNGGACALVRAAGVGFGKLVHAASEQEQEQVRREDREQLLQRKRDRERERRLQLKAQRQRELLALGDANDLSGSEMAAGGSGSVSSSGSEGDSGAEGGADYAGRLGEASHRAHAASSRKRRRRHRQARAAAAALGGGSDEEGGEHAGAGEHGKGVAGGGMGLQGDGCAPMECEGRMGGAGRMQSGGGLGLESPRRPGARERARDARRRQRQADALREAREAQQQEGGGAEGDGEENLLGQQQKEAAGIQRVLRDRQACGSSRERGGERRAGRGESVVGHGSVLNSRVGSVHHTNGKGVEGVRVGRVRSGSETEKLSNRAAQQQQQQLQQQALMQQQAQLLQRRQQKQQRREARAAEHAQARAGAREAAMANALRLVGVGLDSGSGGLDHCPSQAQPQSTPFGAPCYPLLPPVFVLPPLPLSVGEDRAVRVSGYGGVEGGRPQRSSGSAYASSDCEYEGDEDEEEADLVMGDEGPGSPLPSASASDSYTGNGDHGTTSHSPRGNHLAAHHEAIAAPATACGKAEGAPCRRSSRNTAAAQAAAAAGRGSMEEEMLDAEAAEVLQLMQSMEPEQAGVGHRPGASSRDGTTPSSNSNKGAHSSAGGSAMLRAASVQLEAAPLAPTPSPMTQQPEIIVPRAPLHSCQGFAWPEEEPLLPEEPEPFVLPKAWLLARPPRYEHIKRNVWVSRMRPKRINNKDVSRCTCRPPYVTPDPTQPHVKQLGWGCAENCLNRHSYIHCDPKSCPCGEACSNRPFHLLKGPSMEAFLTDNRGYGVRATEPASRGSFLLEYAGEIIDEPELARRMEAARVAGEPCFYIMDLGAGLYVDARHKGNLARLLNSSCDPNCETQKWHDAATGEPRIGIFATRDIKPGEELTYDYFFQHYGVSAVDTADFICMCGAPNCRGTMDINPGKRKDLGRRIEVHWDGDGVYYRGTVVGYTATSRRHVIMYDDGDKERLCLDTVPHKWLDDEEDDAEDTSIPNGPISARKSAAAAAAAAAALLPNAAGSGGGNHSWGALSHSADLSLTDAHALELLGSDAVYGGGGGTGGTRRFGNGGVPPKKRQRSIMGSGGGGSGGQAGGLGGVTAAPARGGGSGRLRGEARPGLAMGGGGGCDMALLLQAVESELTGGLEEDGGGKGGVEPLLPSSGTGEDAEVAAEEEEMASVHEGSAAAPQTQHAQHAQAHPRIGRGAARRQQVALQREQQAAAAAAQLQQQQTWDESPHQQPQPYSRRPAHSAATAAQRQQQQHAQEQQQGDADAWSCRYHHHQHHTQDSTHNHTRPPELRSRLSIIEEAVGIRISSFALPLFHNQQPPQRCAPVPLDVPSPTDHHPQPLQLHHSLSSTPSASAPQEPLPAPIPVPTFHSPSHNAGTGAAENSSSHGTPLQPSLGGPAAALYALGASADGTLPQGHQQQFRQQQQQQQQQLPRGKPTWHPTPPSPALSAALSVLVSSPTLASLSSMPGVLAKAGNVNLFQAGAAASPWGKGAGSSQQQQLTHDLSGLGHTYLPHWVPCLGFPLMHTTPHFAQN